MLGMSDKNTRSTTRATRQSRHSTSLRMYNFDSGGVQQLFAKIIESLSTTDNHESVVAEILFAMCTHFRFGCGFVYEADHTHTLLLKERFSATRAMELPHSFRLEEQMDPEDLQDLLADSFFYQDARSSARLDIFDANTIMLAAIKNQEGVPIGLVGMMDRRRNILSADDQAVDAAKTVLNLLANHIKLHIYQRNLQFTEKSLVDILNNTGVDVYVTDFYTHEILYANESMAAPYGGVKAMLGKKCWDVLYFDKTAPCEDCPQKKMVFDENGRSLDTVSKDYRRPIDGNWIRVLSSAFRWVDGRLAHVISSIDISENKRNEATIAHMANYDALTNLPNRRKLEQDCDEILIHAAAANSRVYLVFFDLDKFKALNDTMGHHIGDQLLAEVGKVLQENPYTKDHVYRYGGDEFVAILPDAARARVQEVVDFLIDRFSRPWDLKTVSPVCRTSIGVACFPDDAGSQSDLLEKADAMMYKAKQTAPGTAVFASPE